MKRPVGPRKKKRKKRRKNRVAQFPSKYDIIPKFKYLLRIMSSSNKELMSPKNSPLTLPAPSDAPAHRLDVNGGGSVKLDDLGPMIVNTDGTLSRITNWNELSEPERERTIRLLVKKRNILRIQSQPQSLAEPTGSSNDPLSIVGEPAASGETNRDVSNKP